MTEPIVGEANKPWVPGEVAEIVEAYFDLLAAQVRGERPSKSDVVRALTQTLPARNAAAIE